MPPAIGAALASLAAFAPALGPALGVAVPAAGVPAAAGAGAGALGALGALGPISQLGLTLSGALNPNIPAMPKQPTVGFGATTQPLAPPVLPSRTGGGLTPSFSPDSSGGTDSGSISQAIQQALATLTGGGGGDPFAAYGG